MIRKVDSEKVEEVVARLKWIIAEVQKQGVEKVAALIYATGLEAETKAGTPLICENRLAKQIIGCADTKLWKLTKAQKICKIAHNQYDLRSILRYIRERKQAETQNRVPTDKRDERCTNKEEYIENKAGRDNINADKVTTSSNKCSKCCIL